MHHVMTAACCCLLVLGTGCQSPNGTSGSQSARLSQIEASEQAFRKMLEKEADLDWASEEVQDVVSRLLRQYAEFANGYRGPLFVTRSSTSSRLHWARDLGAIAISNSATSRGLRTWTMARRVTSTTWRIRLTRFRITTCFERLGLEVCRTTRFRSQGRAALGIDDDVKLLRGPRSSSATRSNSVSLITFDLFHQHRMH